jgi:hypothetical protein
MRRIEDQRSSRATASFPADHSVIACHIVGIVEPGFGTYSRRYMNTVWTVERNTGARAALVAGDLKKQLWRSLVMTRLEFFQLLPEGALLDDRTLLDIVKILG